MKYFFKKANPETKITSPNPKIHGGYGVKGDIAFMGGYGFQRVM
jgi:hypothetical protein